MVQESVGFPPPVEVWKWASYVEDRSPKFKMHKNRGQAMNAVMYQYCVAPRGGVIYKLETIDSTPQWVENFSYTQDMMCVICNELIIHIGHAVKVNYNSPREETKLAHYQCKYPRYNM